MIEAGAIVYYNDPEDSWVLGRVSKWDEAQQTGSCTRDPTLEGPGARPATNPPSSKATIDKLKQDDVFVARDDLLTEDVNDLLNLMILHDATLLNCLRRRYLRDVIYTNIGAIVVALNPFNYNIPWYKDDQMPNYLEEDEVIQRNLPHSWATAHNTYWELRKMKCDQSILVSGESGAGKTEASKIVMKYLAQLSCKEGNEEQKKAGMQVGIKINKTSPILECFGNAKTVRNDNSSRFGKFMQVKFDESGFLVGAFVIKYLLEKSRIVGCMPGERCYHSFYVVTKATPDSHVSVGTGDDPQGYAKELSSVRGRDGDFVNLLGKTRANSEFNTEEEFALVCDSMASIGVDRSRINSMWAVIAGLLHLGNVTFKSDGQEGSVIENEKNLKAAADLLQIDSEGLIRELKQTILEVGGTQVAKILNPDKALDVKESFMKGLYDAQFEWIVTQCNTTLDVPDSGANWIGLLDIFGFEDFQVNSFEQICINLANETLQGHYNEYIFKKDVDECHAEGIDMSAVEFPDNTPCLDMVAGGKNSIMGYLDEECSLGQGTDLSFLEKISDKYKDHAFFVRKILQKTSFTIKHYAGDVTYEVAGWLEKNKDTLKEAFKVLARNSNDPFIAQLLGTQKGPKLTVGFYFKNQLTSLMDMLNSTNPHWIRCVKPHPAKKPLFWSGVSVMAQLSSSGVLGTVKIRKAGYPVRIKIDPDFLQQYRILGATVEEIMGKFIIVLEEKRKVLREEEAALIEKNKNKKNAAPPVPSVLCQLDVSQLIQRGKHRMFLKSEAYILIEEAKKK